MNPPPPEPAPSGDPEVPRPPQAIVGGEPLAAWQLVPLVYDELRAVAATRLAREAPGQTLQATALVHEAYLSLIRSEPDRPWDGRDHFIAAASEAMGHILIDRARRKATSKHGGALRRLDLDAVEAGIPGSSDRTLALAEALAELSRHDELAARLVVLRYLSGMSHQEAADSLGIGRRAADRLWALARTWLFRRLAEP
jgi:RNA polymerase sigma factor (TIGR02999 family)